MRAVTNPGVAEFCDLVKIGLDAWTDAGRLLCALREKNPNICVDIIKHDPRMTLEILRTFERLGRGEIYAPLLMDGSMGARKLLQLPYSQQRQLYDAKISVAVWRRGEVMVEEKAVRELTRREAEIAFNCESVRPIKEQMMLVRPVAQRASTESKYTRGRAPNEKAENLESLDDNPEETVDGKLAQAQAAIIQARELMERQKINVPALHNFCTVALNALGNWRFELSELGKTDQRITID